VTLLAGRINSNHDVDIIDK